MNNEIISLESNLSAQDRPAETQHHTHLIIDGSNTQNVPDHIEEDNKKLDQGSTKR
jgi:methionine synthase II (cobalamin-independent)